MRENIKKVIDCAKYLNPFTSTTIYKILRKNSKNNVPKKKYGKI